MRVEMGKTKVIRNWDNVRCNFAIVQKFELVKEDGFRKQCSVSAGTTLSDFQEPSRTDYAEAFELIAKQLRELEP